MFQIAVLGPQFADRLGIVQQCMQCRAASGPDAPPCPGFGPGCLVTPRAIEMVPGTKLSIDVAIT
jgi:hypothetical protein